MLFWCVLYVFFTLSRFCSVQTTVPSFTHSVTDGKLTISTAAVTLTYTVGQPFSSSSLSVKAVKVRRFRRVTCLLHCSTDVGTPPHPFLLFPRRPTPALRRGRTASTTPATCWARLSRWTTWASRTSTAPTTPRSTCTPSPCTALGASCPGTAGPSSTTPRTRRCLPTPSGGRAGPPTTTTCTFSDTAMTTAAPSPTFSCWPVRCCLLFAVCCSLFAVCCRFMAFAKFAPQVVSFHVGLRRRQNRHGATLGHGRLVHALV